MSGRTIFEQTLNAFMDAGYHELSAFPTNNQGNTDIGKLLDNPNVVIPTGRRRNYSQNFSLFVNCLLVLQKNDNSVNIEHKHRILEATKENLFPEHRNFCTKIVFDRVQKTISSSEDLLLENTSNVLKSPSIAKNPFNNEKLLGWFLKDIVKIIPHKIFFLGNGPFEKDQIERVMFNLGIEITNNFRDAEVVVIGRHKIDLLSNLVKSDLEDVQKLYTQEMFICVLIGKDPFLQDSVMDMFSENHPALQFMKQWDFQWPKTNVFPSNNTKSIDTNWPDIGMLKFLGYSVGINGTNKSTRKTILKKCFLSNQLPNVISQDYIDKWGRGGSSTRLQKIANSIATFAKNSKRKNKPDGEAIKDWEEDLNWLHRQFYLQNKFKFSWPNTSY